jgi:protocatechuate 3,4-dioxygenase beta subunit
VTTAPAAGTVSGAQGALTVFDPLALPLVSVAPVVKFTNNLAAYDNLADYGGSSGVSNARRSATATASQVLLPPYTAYIQTGSSGPGTVELTLSALSSGFCIGPANFLLQINPDMGATVTVTYEYEEPVSEAGVGDLVWNDYNGNGVLEPGEPGLAGVTVSLLGWDGLPVAGVWPTVTDEYGYYSFTGIPAGQYYVVIEPPVGFNPTYDADGVDGSNSAYVDVPAGTFVDWVDFGLAQLTSTVGDRVWIDANGNGTQDTDEIGLSGVTVEIRDASGTVIASVPTDINGTYGFSGLVAGTYTVSVVGAPAGYAATWDADGVGTPSSTEVTLNAGEVVDAIDFGYQPRNSAIGDRVWQDRNSDGLQDANEPGLAGLSLELRSAVDQSVIATAVTDGNGVYAFTGLAAGDYLVVVSAPAGYQATFDLDGVGSASQTQIQLGVEEVRDDVDFGYAGGRLGDRVWSDANGDGVQDSGEAGIVGATVTLSTGATTTTDANGYYSFGDLPAGSYTVTVNVPAGWVATFDADGIATAGSTQVTLGVGEVLDTVDFGYQERTASVGDRVWADDNGDGIQDGGEAGISGVAVELRNAAGDTVLGSATTDANGFFQFQNLAAGVYTVLAAQPAHHLPTFDLDGLSVPNATAVVLGVGEARNDVDFGYQPLGTIGNLVWLDLDENGEFDSETEPGLSGVTVTVSGTGGTFTTVTDENGGYYFDSLPPGTYTVSVTPPDGVEAVYDFDGVGTPNLTTVTLAAGGANLDVDFGYNIGENLLTADIGGRVWDDADASGAPNFPEVGLPGLPVALVDDVGTVVTSGFTDAAGYYSFLAVPAGSYRVQVVPAAYWGPTFDIDGTGSPNSAATPVNAGDVLSGVDFGYQYAPPPGSLGDRVWNDANGNGQQDVGELGLGGVTVQIRDSNGDLLTSAVTDGAGNYSFLSVDAGTYQISVVPPQYYDATGDLDGVSTPNTTVVVVAIGQERSDIDFGLFYNPPPAFVGDRVWNDANSNGIQDLSEVGLPGVAVTLRDAGGAVVATATTDGVGEYSFPGLASGSYSVTVTAPQYYIPTFDADGIGSENVASFTLAIGQTNRGVDFGLVFAPPLGNVGDLVWSDANSNGIVDNAEAGIPNLTVTLRDGAGAVVTTTTTDSVGKYHFTGLAAGTYSVEVELPASGVPTFDLDGTGTANRASFSLAIGEDKTDVDFGYHVPVPPALGSIGDRVWIDDGNGTYESGERGLTNAVVTLRNGLGQVVDTITVGDDGAYLFSGLEAGTYTVTVTPPANYFATYDLDGLTTPDRTEISLLAGDNRLDVDFAYAFVAPDPMVGRIGDRVWLDLNGNGSAEGNEPGITGVTVRLLNASGSVIGVDTTGTDGTYEFVNLAGGQYRVTVEAPAGHSPTYDLDGVSTANTAELFLVAGTEMLDVDFGYLPPGFATIGNRVWIDRNSNGVQESTEAGLACVRVILSNAAGTPVGTNITTSTGAYLFPNLAPGTYTVRVIPPANYGPTWDVDGISTANRATVTVVAGQSRLDVDFGYVACAGTGRIGDLVWIDSDGDGTRDNNGCRASESGLPNATVRLYDVNGYLLATQQTDSNGRYQFTGLLAATYTVIVTPPTGYTPTFDLDGILTPHTATLALGAGQTRNDVDFGYIRYSGHGGNCDKDDDKDSCDKDGDKDKDSCDKDGDKDKDSCDKDNDKDKDSCDKDGDKDKDSCDKDGDKDKDNGGSSGGSCYRNGGNTGTRCTPSYWRGDGQRDLRPFDFAALCQLRLVNDNGSDRDFNSNHGSNKVALSSWLNSTSSSNMSRSLSVHLACFQLNVLHGCYRSTSVVSTPGIGSGSMTAAQLITACNNALNADRNTPVGDPNRVTQERLRNALDACNQAARR